MLLCGLAYFLFEIYLLENAAEKEEKDLWLFGPGESQEPRAPSLVVEAQALLASLQYFPRCTSRELSQDNLEMEIPPWNNLLTGNFMWMPG